MCICVGDVTQGGKGEMRTMLKAKDLEIIHLKERLKVIVTVHDPKLVYLKICYMFVTLH